MHTAIQRASVSASGVATRCLFATLIVVLVVASGATSRMLLMLRKPWPVAIIGTATTGSTFFAGFSLYTNRKATSTSNTCPRSHVSFGTTRHRTWVRFRLSLLMHFRCNSRLIHSPINTITTITNTVTTTPDDAFPRTWLLRRPQHICGSHGQRVTELRGPHG